MPTIDRRAALLLLAPLLARGPMGLLAGCAVDVLGDLGDDLDALAVGIRDLSLASGPTLDYLGAQVGEGRDGLADDEYRRLIAGRRVALAGGVEAGAVLRCIRALSGGEEARIDDVGPGRLAGQARVSAPPSGPWLARAQSVVADTVAAGVRWVVTFYPPDGAIFDGSPGFDAGVFGFDIGG
jgi:hypothetical protein